jgi:hypothetical protein
MKKTLLILSLLMLFSCGETPKKKEQTDKPVIALADFDAKAGKWLGKEVQIKGIVDHVCKHGGKKITVVDENGEVHVKSEERFDDAMVGSEITLIGIVDEFVVDESFCLQKEEDYNKSFKDGTDDAETHQKKLEQIQSYRDSIKSTGKDHISFYSLKYISHKEKK